MNGWAARLVLKLAGVAFIAAVFGVFIPDRLARVDGVFTRQQFVDTLERRLKDTPQPSPRLRQIVAYEQGVDNLRAQRFELERSVKGANGRQLAETLTLQAAVDKAIEGRPDLVVPFYGSILVALWCWTFFAMGCLIWICPPGAMPWSTGNGHSPGATSEPELAPVDKPEDKAVDNPPVVGKPALWRALWTGLRTPLEVIFVGAIIFLFYEWPTLWRTGAAPFDDAYPPHEIYFNTSVAGFYSNAYDMFENVAYSLMLAFVLLKWIRYAVKIGHEFKVGGADVATCDYVAMALDSHLAHRTVVLFEEWLVVSLLFASSYMFDTIFYWHQLETKAGSVYEIQALLEHVVWGVSWLVISAPILRIWRYWHRTRLNAAEWLYRNTGGLTDQLKSLFELSRPLNSWVLLIVNVGAFATFVVSLLHAVLH